MGRPKKVKAVVVGEEDTVATVLDGFISTPPNEIYPVSVDFPSEQLNDLARKVNEIINHINQHGQ